MGALTGNIGVPVEVRHHEDAARHHDSDTNINGKQLHQLRHDDPAHLSSSTFPAGHKTSL